MSQQYTLEGLIHRLYPYELMLGQEGKKVVQDALKVSESWC